MRRLTIRVLISLFVLITAGAGFAPLASAQEPGALVNGVAVCPQDLDGASIDPAACAEPAANVGFYAANPNTGNVAFGDTGGDGLVSFALDQFAINPDGATVEVGLILGSDPYGAVAGHIVGCSRNGEALELTWLDSAVQPGGASLAVQFTVFPGDQVACEWYVSHASDIGDIETPPAADDGADDDQSGGDRQATGPVTALPSTGAGSGEDGSGDAALLAGAAAVALAGGIAGVRLGRQVSR